MDFDDMAFAHMLKDYSVFSFPSLVMQFRTVFFNAVVYRAICIKSLSHLHHLVQSAVSLFFISLSSGVSAPHSQVLFHCKVACLLLTV